MSYQPIRPTPQATVLPQHDVPFNNSATSPPNVIGTYPTTTTPIATLTMEQETDLL